MKNIAIIPARGGSKRIPQKNIKSFLGKPIIAYSIEAALKSNVFDEIMVSTDDNEIAELAKKLGANVPFVRSERNSGDNSSTSDVLVEVLNEYKKLDQEFDYGCCIYPCAPFVDSNKINEGLQLIKKTKADNVIPVVKYSYPIQRALKIEGEKLLMISPDNITTRSQDLPPTYHDAGQYYWFKIQSFLKEPTLFSENTVPIIIPEIQSQDIDTLEDWEIAELKYKLLKY